MVAFNLLIFALLFRAVGGFLRLPLGSPFNIKNNEIKQPIPLELTPSDQEIVQQINGVYGLIGPDLNIKDIHDLYHLFTGDGIIQACFFDKGELRFVKKYVRTDKIEYEKCYGRVLHNKGIQMLFFILSRINVLPDVFGRANTAVVQMGKKYFALYERDQPYEIFFDFNKKTIHTGKRIGPVKCFSAHPKIRNSENLVETVEYNILQKSVHFHRLDSELVLQKTLKTPMTYLPLVHDFISTPYNFMVMDSPFVLDIFELFKKSMPVSLSQRDPTYIRAVNKLTGRVRTYKSNKSFAAFHYAQVREDENRIQIFAPIYEHIDFSELNLQGKYRCLTLDKRSQTIKINKNEALENLNLDFPVRFGDKIILRSIKDNICGGFVICLDLEIIHTIEIKDRFICGEPQVIYLRGSPYLIFFSFDITQKANGFVNVLSLNDYHHIEIPMNAPLKYGFHAFFASNP
jgi:hypothetical protein